jgi:integral membrane sensor domain MASE1
LIPYELEESSRPVPLAAFAGACLVSAEIGRWFIVMLAGWSLPIIWLPAGVLLAALVLSEPRQWAKFVLTAALATLVSDVLHGQPALVSAAFSVVRSLEACLAAGILRRVIDGPFTLTRVPHVVALIVVAVVVPLPGGALASEMLRNLAGGASFLALWRAWSLANVLGVLLTAPPAFEWMGTRSTFLNGVSSWRRLESLVVLAGAVAISHAVFAEALPPLVSVPSYILPFLLWAALRLAPDGAGLTVLFVSLIGLWNTAHGRGPFALLEASPMNWILRSQGGITVTSVSLLLLTSVVAERRRATQERAMLIADLQQALVEIKTLRGFIPLCAWCHKVRNDEGFWQGIETYLHDYSDAIVSHSICPECDGRMQVEIKTATDSAAPRES